MRRHEISATKSIISKLITNWEILKTLLPVCLLIQAIQKKLYLNKCLGFAHTFNVKYTKEFQYSPDNRPHSHTFILQGKNTFQESKGPETHKIVIKNYKKIDFYLPGGACYGDDGFFE